MKHKAGSRGWPLWMSVGLALLLVACGGGGGGSTPTPTPDPLLKRPSKSGTIAITGDDKYVVQVNTENDSITIFRTSDDSKLAELPVGDEPSAVVIHPDDKTAFVALRAERKVVKVNNIDTSTPSVAAISADVGSEPTGIALNPCGSRLAVAEFGEGRVALLNTSNFATVGTAIVAAPRAVAISNNGNTDCNDEKLVVTEFYGRITGAEATDNSRTGAVRIFNEANLSPLNEVLFAPTDPGNFPVDTAEANTVVNFASPNLLSSVVIVGNKFFATATAASPDNAPKFDENVFQYLLVGDLNGTNLGTISLSEAIRTLNVPAPATKLFMGDIVDIGVVGDSILYVLAKGGEAIQRAFLTGNTSVTLGTPSVPQIDLQTLSTKCQNPTGLVTPHVTTDQRKMFVNCWVTRNTGIVDLGTQTLTKVVAATAAPSAGSLEDKQNRGRHFYFTGRGRWSRDGAGWSSCGSCHPDGLSDNITWRFAAGPRQSTSMDGSFSHGPGTQKQRIYNWTGIFDEQHDFERNTRDVSGGVGALVKDLALVNTSRLALTLTGGAAIGGLAKPLRELQEGTVSGPAATDPGPSLLKDWDEIDEFVKTIRPVRARRFIDSASVTRGLALFRSSNCTNCHSGQGWTLSRRFFVPSGTGNAALTTTAFNGNNPGLNSPSPHTFQI
ncbi:MAG: YncE family protein, partial [Meiothermus sp.]|nr:YncE family protein [Meiothermus sp.]